MDWLNKQAIHLIRSTVIIFLKNELELEQNEQKQKFIKITIIIVCEIHSIV